jgi:hypothetical protein
MALSKARRENAKSFPLKTKKRLAKALGSVLRSLEMMLNGFEGLRDAASGDG